MNRRKMTKIKVLGSELQRKADDDLIKQQKQHWEGK
jgi:hypothetical protein